MSRGSTFLILLLLPLPGVCQIYFGLKAGLNVSDVVMTNYVNPDVEADLRLKMGVHAGVFVNAMVEERLGLAAEILYSDKGTKGSENIHLHYVTVPLLFQYTLNDRFAFELGPELGYLFSARSRHGDFSGTYKNKLDFSLDGGLRFDATRLAFMLRYCVGLSSVREPFEYQGSSGIESVKYQNRVLQLSVGYKLFAIQAP